MDKKKIYIRLTIIVPAIFSGIVILTVLVTSRIMTGSTKDSALPLSSLTLWLIVASLFTFLCGYLILSRVLNPLNKFISETQRLSFFPPLDPETPAREKKDELERYVEVFDQITSILSNVEAQELFPDSIGQSQAMRSIFSQVLKVAPTDSTVLISGESGTGKELMAISIYEHSRRKGKPFIKLNCVAIPEGLLESELFGHEKGAFTGAVAQKKGKFELASGGTIFLDEIGDMPLSTQAKLLRVLEEREFEPVGSSRPIKVDIRIIAATNKNLPEMVKTGMFREDLYYRLNVFSLHLVPLRDRKEDIPVLAEYFLETVKPARLSSAALQLLLAYAWPGNVRELKNTLERAAVMAEDDVIEPIHLPAEVTGRKGQMPALSGANMSSLDDHLDQVEKELIMDALQRAGGVQVRAAQLLGINQRSLWHRLKKHGIDSALFKNQQKM